MSREYFGARVVILEEKRGRETYGDEFVSKGAAGLVWHTKDSARGEVYILENFLYIIVLDKGCNRFRIILIVIYLIVFL